MIALHEAIEVLYQEVESPAQGLAIPSLTRIDGGCFAGDGRAEAISFGPETPRLAPPMAGHFIYSSYAAVLPVVLILGWAYLFVVGEIGVAATVAAAFALSEITAAAVVIGERNG